MDKKQNKTSFITNTCVTNTDVICINATVKIFLKKGGGAYLALCSNIFGDVKSLWPGASQSSHLSSATGQRLSSAESD